MSNNWLVGQVVRLSVAITDIAGNAADPTTLTLRICDPSSSVTEYTGDQLTKDSTGNYHYDLSLDVAGSYEFDWSSTGNNAGVTQNSFYVYPKTF